MEMSCLPVSFFQDIAEDKMSIGDWAAVAKSVGLSNIDLSCMFLKNRTPVYLRGVKESVEKQNMGIKMITTYPDFSHPSKIQRDRELAYLYADIAAASYLEVPYIRLTAGQQHDDISTSEGIKNVVEYFKYSMDFADKMGVTLVYENHAKPGAWDRYDFSYATDIFLEIFEKTADMGLLVNFDTGNPVAYADEDEPMKILKKVIKRLGTVHIADSSTKGILTHSVIGKGLVRFEEIFAYLKENGYDGLISIEEGSCTGKEGIKTAVDFVKGMWG